MAAILLVGQHRFLLESRASVLRFTCSETLCTSEDDIAKLGSQEVDLVILCHSVRLDRRISLCEQIRRMWPGVRILQVVTTLLDMASARSYADAIAASLNPDELVAISAKLLGQRTSARKARHR